MVEDEEYELTPHKELEELKREVDRLKKNPLGKSSSAKDLMSSVQELNLNICRLIDIFETAMSDMKDGGHAMPVGDGDNMEFKGVLDTLIDQNKHIAEGILSVADTLNEKKNEPHHFEAPEPKRSPPQINTGMPSSMPSPSGMPPMPPPSQSLGAPGNMPPPPGMNPDLPPLPSFGEDPFADELPKKKGFFGK